MISTSEFNAIAELDLDPIKMKLMHNESGEGWSAEKANAVEIEYRRFLYLMKTFPTEQTAPLEDVDTFWHYHILDTMKYALDCERALGYFLHHYPYLGILGENCDQELQACGNRMQELYEQTFGNSYDEVARAIAGAGSNPPVNDQAAYCTAGARQAAYCTASTRQAAYCTTSIKHAAYCTAGTKQAAYCTTSIQQAAYCTTSIKQAAYCTTSTKQAAYCTAGNRHPAYCTSVSKQATDFAVGNDAVFRTSVSENHSGLLLQAA